MHRKRHYIHLENETYTRLAIGNVRNFYSTQGKCYGSRYRRGLVAFLVLRQSHSLRLKKWYISTTLLFKMVRFIGLTIQKECLLRFAEVIVGLTALGVGGFLYILLRTENLLMFSWFDEIGLSQTVDNIRMLYGQQTPYAWVKNNLPAGLWLFSYLFIIDSLWWKEKNNVYKFFLFLLPIIAIGSEFLQLLKIVPGTFDELDICSYISALLLYILIKKL